MADFKNAAVGDTVRVLGFFGVVSSHVMRLTGKRIKTTGGWYRRSDGLAVGYAKGFRILREEEYPNA